jgi:uncharacterized protein (DUF305 family)
MATARPDTDERAADGPEATGARRSRAWLVPGGLALVTAALLAGLLLGRGTAADGPQRVTDAVSLGFVRDMSTHHAQAVRMSEVAHRRSTDPELTYLAFDILSTQQGQIGIMTGWLDLWEQSQSADAEPMAWMGHAGPMPGMATDAELAALDALPVAQMEEQWLRLMIRHHRGAVPMADAAAEQATSPQTARFAASMSTGQQSEIDLMQRLLADRGLPPEGEDPTAGHSDRTHSAPTGEAAHDGH